MGTLEPNRQKIIEVLERHGLDPNTMTEDGWNRDGYEVYTREGLSSHPWPDDTVYKELREAWWSKDKPNLEKRAVRVVKDYLSILTVDDLETPNWVMAEEIVDVLKQAGVRF